MIKRLYNFFLLLRLICLILICSIFNLWQEIERYEEDAYQ